jgi:hypothetical protein
VDFERDEKERTAAAKEHGTLRAVERMTRIVAAQGLERRRPAAGDLGFVCGEMNRSNGGPICRFFTI